MSAPEPPHQAVGVVDEFGRISMIESTARWHHLESQQMIGPAREAFRRIQRKRARLREILPSIDVEGRKPVASEKSSMSA